MGSTCAMYIIRHIFNSGPPTASMSTSHMVFSVKTGKQKSIKPKDKRKLSMLAVDYKVLTGVLAARLRKTEGHTLSPQQYAVSNKKVSHTIIEPIQGHDQQRLRQRQGLGSRRNGLSASIRSDSCQMGVESSKSKGMLHKLHLHHEENLRISEPSDNNHQQPRTTKDSKPAQQHQAGL